MIIPIWMILDGVNHTWIRVMVSGNGWKTIPQMPTEPRMTLALLARKTPCSSSLATMVWHFADCSLGKDFSVSCMIFWKSCQTALLERELTRLGSSDLHRWPGSIAFGHDSLDEPKMPLDPWKDDRWQSTQKSIKNGDLKLLQQNTWESSSLA